MIKSLFIILGPTFISSRGKSYSLPPNIWTKHIILPKSRPCFSKAINHNKKFCMLTEQWDNGFWFLITDIISGIPAFIKVALKHPTNEEIAGLPSKICHKVLTSSSFKNSFWVGLNGFEDEIGITSPPSFIHSITKCKVPQDLSHN